MVKPRNAVLDLKTCEHGGIKRSMSPEIDLIDFSASLNPYGPPKFIADAIKKATNEINIYPDSESLELKAVISERFGFSKDELLIGAGITELIRLVALTFVKKRVVIPKHTYGEYEPASKMMGASVKKIEMPELVIKPEMISQNIGKNDIIFLCNPNNPTGQYLKEDEIRSVSECAEDKNALLVIDEAYMDFVEGGFDSTKLALHSDNLIILRSLTKSFTIPGIRLGYLVGSKDNIKVMEKTKPPWNISIFAQMIGVRAMKDESFLNESQKRISKSKKKIERLLDVHSDANFYLYNVKNAKKAKKKLIDHQILIRDCTSFGLPHHIRFSVRKDEENEMLIDMLQSCGY